MTRMDPVKETWMFNMVTHTDEHRRRSNGDPEDASRVLSPRTRTRFGDRAHLHAHNAATNPVQVSVELQSHVRAAKTDSQEKSQTPIWCYRLVRNDKLCHCFKKEHQFTFVTPLPHLTLWTVALFCARKHARDVLTHTVTDPAETHRSTADLLPSASNILGMSRCFSATSKALFRLVTGSS